MAVDGKNIRLGELTFFCYEGDSGFRKKCVEAKARYEGTEIDSRNGVKELLGGSLLAKARFLPEIVRHPGWLAGFPRDGGVPKLPNVVILGRGQYRSSTSARLWQPPRSVGKTYGPSMEELRPWWSRTMEDVSLIA